MATVLNETEKRIMTKRIVTAIRGDDFKVEIGVFIDYARATYPLIRSVGIAELWRIYQSDPTI